MVLAPSTGRRENGDRRAPGALLASLSPRGVTARWSAPKRTSVSTARAATRIAAPSRPASPYVLTLMIGSPSVTMPASGAIVAVATTLTIEMRMPPKMSGRAIGSSTWRTMSIPRMPIPREASTMPRSTWRTPTKVFVRMGGMARSTSASVTLAKPTPR